MPTTDLPAWLKATWSRNYIRRAAADSRELGEPDRSVRVRYIQTLADGHSFDLRIPDGFQVENSIRSVHEMNIQQLRTFAEAGVEAFAGVTTAELAGNDTTVRWHYAFTFPPSLDSADDPMALFDLISSGKHETKDVGRAVPSLPPTRGKPVVHWYEHAPDGSYEEEWVMFEEFFSRGAHLAAVRPARSGVGACWLGILGNTFGFVRDIDRSALPDDVRNRPVAEILADEAIPLTVKRTALDCEFSFGKFGQGGGVGGVVELSSLPWRVGIALAMLLDGDEAAPDAPPWEPIRAADAGAMHQAIAAIKSDHEKACRQLRDAEENGNTGVADLMKARGAVA